MYVSGYATSNGCASGAELTAYFEPFGMVVGSLDMKTSPTASRDGAAACLFRRRQPGGGDGASDTSHVLEVNGEETRLRVNWATDQRNLPPSPPPRKTCR